MPRHKKAKNAFRYTYPSKYWANATILPASFISLTGPISKAILNCNYSTTKYIINQGK